MIIEARITTTIGVVITRNRKHKTAHLSDLLSDINDYGLPKNVAVLSCRFRSPDKNWEVGWNLGPKTYYALGEKNGIQNNWISGSAFGKEVNFTK